MKKILVIGVGKRVIEDVLPALAASGCFQVAGIFARRSRTVEAGDRAYEVSSSDDLSAGHVAAADWVYVGVPTAALPDVLRRLATFPGSRNVRLLIDTPALPMRHAWRGFPRHAFAEVLVAEDAPYLPWVAPATRALGGAVTEMRFDCSAYRYHGVALVKALAGCRKISSARSRRVSGATSLDFVAANGAKAVVVEPRDYQKGSIWLLGPNGALSEKPAAGELSLRLLFESGRCIGVAAGGESDLFSEAEISLLGVVNQSATVTSLTLPLKRVGLRRMLVGLVDGTDAGWSLDEAADDTRLDELARRVGCLANAAPAARLLSGVPRPGGFWWWVRPVTFLTRVFQSRLTFPVPGFWSLAERVGPPSASGLFRLKRGVTRTLSAATSSERWLIVSGDFQPAATAEMLARLAEGDVAVDVGANLGFYSLIFASAVGARGRVFAFEPNPTLAADLEAAARENSFSWIEVRREAASDVSGEVVLHLHPQDLGKSSIVRDAEGSVGLGVRAVTLDSCFPPGSPRVALVKIDAEGADARVVLGARNLIARDRPSLLLERTPGDDEGYREAAALLSGLGYTFRAVPNRGRAFPVSSAAALVALPQVDVLALPPKTHLDGLLRHFPNLLSRRILDVGCGRGAFVAHVAARGGEVVGLEPNPAYAEETRARLSSAGVAAEIVGNPGETMPFPDASFGFANVCEVIEHVEDPRATMREIARVLEPGGEAYMSAPNRFGFRDQHFHLYGINWIPRSWAERVIAAFGRSREDSAAGRQTLSRMSYFTRGSFSRLAAEAGLEAEDLRERLVRDRVPALVRPLAIFAYRLAATFILDAHHFLLRKAESSGRLKP